MLVRRIVGSGESFQSGLFRLCGFTFNHCFGLPIKGEAESHQPRESSKIILERTENEAERNYFCDEKCQYEGVKPLKFQLAPSMIQQKVRTCGDEKPDKCASAPDPGRNQDRKRTAMKIAGHVRPIISLRRPIPRGGSLTQCVGIHAVTLSHQ